MVGNGPDAGVWCGATLLHASVAVWRASSALCGPNGVLPEVDLAGRALVVFCFDFSCETSGAEAGRNGCARFFFSCGTIRAYGAIRATDSPFPLSSATSVALLSRTSDLARVPEVTFTLLD